jgi:hypothetical protein
LHVLLPDEARRRLPSVTETWMNFGREHADEQFEAEPLAIRNADDVDRTVGRELWADQRFQFERYAESIEPSRHPTLFVFHLSADQEVPPSGSTARGGCFGQLDQTTRRLALVCTHNAEQPTLAHVHRGAPGVNGPVVFDLGDPVSPMEATWNMTAAEMADLLAGNFYVSIHASGRPEGEIRGQMLTRTVDRFNFGLSGSQEVPPTDSTASGNCVADLADNATSVLVECTHNVDSIVSSHLHTAPPGVDGPVVFDFPNTNQFSNNAPLTPRLVADFAAGFLYVNIHSVDYDAGEIRGNLFGTAAPAHAADIPTASEWGLILLAMALLFVALKRT